MTCAVLLHCNSSLKRSREKNCNIFDGVILCTTYLSRTAKTTLSAGHFLITLVALLWEYPATSSPLILRIWSPNRRPPKAAGEPDLTKHTNIPCGRKMISQLIRLTD